jgi:hypothetical protein
MKARNTISIKGTHNHQLQIYFSNSPGSPAFSLLANSGHQYFKTPFPYAATSVLRNTQPFTSQTLR